MVKNKKMLNPELAKIESTTKLPTFKTMVINTMMKQMAFSKRLMILNILNLLIVHNPHNIKISNLFYT